MTYADACKTVYAKLYGQTVEDKELSQAFAQYPEIWQKVKVALLDDVTSKSVSPTLEMPEIPDWAKAGLRRMSDLG